VSSIAQQALEFSTGTLAFVGKTYAFLLLVVFLLQRKLIFLPSNQVADPRAYAKNLEVIRLSGPQKDTTLAAIYMPRPSSAVVVFFHGNADQLGWGPVYLGNQLQQAGLGFYGIEYPGYGLAQPGSPTEESIYAAAQVMLDHLINELKVDKSSLVLVGQSIGCGAAVEMARQGYGQKLLLLSPFTSLLALSQRIYPVFAPALKIFPFLLNDKFDNLAKAKQVSSETLVIHQR